MQPQQPMQQPMQQEEQDPFGASVDISTMNFSDANSVREALDAIGNPADAVEQSRATVVSFTVTTDQAAERLPTLGFGRR